MSSTGILVCTSRIPTYSDSCGISPPAAICLPLPYPCPSKYTSCNVSYFPQISNVFFASSGGSRRSSRHLSGLCVDDPRAVGRERVAHPRELTSSSFRYSHPRAAGSDQDNDPRTQRAPVHIALMVRGRSSFFSRQKRPVQIKSYHFYLMLPSCLFPLINALISLKMYNLFYQSLPNYAIYSIIVIRQLKTLICSEKGTEVWNIQNKATGCRPASPCFCSLAGRSFGPAHTWRWTISKVWKDQSSALESELAGINQEIISILQRISSRPQKCR